MIVSHAPMRVSLFGGGTDLPEWSSKHGGAVLGFALDKYTHIYLRKLLPFSKFKHRLVYSKVEDVDRIADIQHRAIKAVLQEYWGDEGFGLELTHMGDLPAMAGTGSSSSFVVAMLNAIQHILHGNMPKAAAQWIYQESVRIEREVIGEFVGQQDQAWAAFGGFNRIDFAPNGAATVTKMPDGRAHELTSHLLMGFTGFTRFAEEVEREKAAGFEANSSKLHAIRAMVDQAADVILNGYDIRIIGQLLHETWMMKRGLSDRVSNPEIDAMYETARKTGAIGGKLMGAGAGGFLLLFAEPEKHADIKAALPGTIWVDVGIGRGAWVEGAL